MRTDQLLGIFRKRNIIGIHRIGEGTGQIRKTREEGRDSRFLKQKDCEPTGPDRSANIQHSESRMLGHTDYTNNPEISDLQLSESPEQNQLIA